jgi:hypothetical protein
MAGLDRDFAVVPFHGRYYRLRPHLNPAAALAA